MSDKPTTPTVATPPGGSSSSSEEVIVYSHSSIFYWWPVWAVGYLMAAVTFIDGSRGVVVPKDSTYHENATITTGDVVQNRAAVVLPEGEKLADGQLRGDDEHKRLGFNTAPPSKNLGVLYTIILLVVVFVTNVPLRGLWSGIAVLVVALISVLFAWLGVWNSILSLFGQVTIQMNLGFFLFFSTVLFVIWAAITFGFDRMAYWKFRPGQVTYEFVFGGGEKAYDTTGMTVEKLRDDIFRHGLLGFGSGDLVLHSPSAGREDLVISNVLNIGAKVERLQKLVAQRPN
jgi:hypothetical protein